jgi:hypothetical protein
MPFKDRYGIAVLASIIFRIVTVKISIL